MFKYLLSYLSFGLLAPFFQTFRSEKKYSFELCGKLSKLENLEEDDFVTAHRLVYAEPKKYSRKVSTFYLKYKNFMYSPKSHFVYKNVSI